MIVRVFLLFMAGSIISIAPTSCVGQDIRIGSKAFTESVILGEIIAQLVRETGASAHHHRQLGGTRILWDALLASEIDIYPEYTGTISKEILSREGLVTEKEIRDALGRRGLAMIGPIGFNNTYAIGVRQETSNRLGITKISDLRKFPELAFGFGKFARSGHGMF